MKTGTKILIIAVIVIFVGAVVALNLRAKDPGDEAEIEVAARKPMISKVTATGALKRFQNAVATGQGEKDIAAVVEQFRQK